MYRFQPFLLLTSYNTMDDLYDIAHIIVSERYEIHTNYTPKGMTPRSLKDMTYDNDFPLKDIFY